MQQLNETTYNEMINENKLTVVKFFGVWCGPCKVLAPALESIVGNYPDVNFGEVDIDQNISLAQKEGIRGVPAVIFYKNGNVLDRLSGLQPLLNYVNKIESLK
jgi:thioredoxin 1